LLISHFQSFLKENPKENAFLVILHPILNLIVETILTFSFELTNFPYFFWTYVSNLLKSYMDYYIFDIIVISTFRLFGIF
jgi:hypothetical protein